MTARVLAAALGFALMIPAAAHAQHVSAEIRVGGYPVSGRIVIGHPYHYAPVVVHRVPSRHVVVARHTPRVLVVHRVSHRHFRCDCRPIRAWYDPHRQVYYDGYRDGLREVAIYRHGGGYYRYDD